MNDREYRTAAGIQEISNEDARQRGAMFDPILRVTFFDFYHLIDHFNHLRDSGQSVGRYQAQVERNKGCFFSGYEMMAKPCTPLQAHLLEFNCGFKRV